MRQAANAATTMSWVRILGSINASNTARTHLHTCLYSYTYIIIWKMLKILSNTIAQFHQAHTHTMMQMPHHARYCKLLVLLYAKKQTASGRVVRRKCSTANIAIIVRVCAESRWLKVEERMCTMGKHHLRATVVLTFWTKIFLVRNGCFFYGLSIYLASKYM